MTTDNKELINKIEDINKETESIKDRERVEDIAKANLFNFLNGYIKRSATKSDLKNKVETMLFEKLEREEEDVPYGVLIKLQEILSKSETDAAIPILKILEAATKREKESELPAPSETLKIGENNVSTEDIKVFKNILELFNGLKKSEFTEGENK
jgi:hypothetical protein